MRPSRLVLIAIVLCGVVGVCGFPLLANSIVLSFQLGRTEASLGVGKRLPDGTTIHLRGGEVIRLLDRKGTRTLKGPGRFRTGVAIAETDRIGKVVDRLTDQSRTTRVAALRSGLVLKPLMRANARASSPRLARAGAVRGGGSPKLPPLWKLIQSGQSGNFCFTGGQRLLVKNPALSGSPRHLELTNVKTEAPVVLLGLAGSPAFQIANPFWPTDGTELRLNDVVTGTTTQITLRQMSLGEGDLVSHYSALDALGCVAQRDHLLASVSERAE